MVCKRDALRMALAWLCVSMAAVLMNGCEVVDEDQDVESEQMALNADLQDCFGKHGQEGYGHGHGGGHGHHGHKHHGWSLEFSHVGPIPGMTCVQILEPEDPDTWWDNYLCSEDDLGLAWSYAGPIAGMHCLLVDEPSDYDEGWSDNYLCSPQDLGLEWSYDGKIHGKDIRCVKFREPSEDKFWRNNYLCGPKKLVSVDPPVQCTSGPCCGADGKFLGDDVRCDDSPYEFERRCSGDECGANVEERAKYLHCSGTSAVCEASDSNLRWEDWYVVNDCGTDAVCDDSPYLPGPMCRTCVDGCDQGECL